jgi:FkbM family methyltransferase
MLTKLESLLAQAKDRRPKNLDENKPIWIFGAGTFGRDLYSALKSQCFNVVGFVETNPNNKSVSGSPVLDWVEWAKEHSDSNLCIGIFNRSTPINNLEKLARNAGAKNIFLPWDIYPLVQNEMGWRFWLSDKKWLMKNTEPIFDAFESLCDDVSKTCFLEIMAFRLGLNINYGDFCHADNQYFNELTLDALTDRAVNYVDAGAYNGDTYLELCSLADVRLAYLFEPDVKNYKELVINSRAAERAVYCIPAGLSDKHEVLNFNSGEGEGGAIASEGKSHITVMSLDEFFQKQKVDFIKMDIEGAEKKALTGAANLINDSCPVIAVSLYHCPGDLWELPLTLKKICNNYRFYIRQHYFNTFESVLYAIPILK